MLMGYYNELTTEMEGNEQEAQTRSRDKAKPANEAKHEKQEGALTQEAAKSLTPLPIVEPLPYSYGSELTGVPMNASMTPNGEQARRKRECKTMGKYQHRRI